MAPTHASKRGWTAKLKVKYWVEKQKSMMNLPQDSYNNSVASKHPELEMSGEQWQFHFVTIFELSQFVFIPQWNKTKIFWMFLQNRIVSKQLFSHKKAQLFDFSLSVSGQKWPERLGPQKPSSQNHRQNRHFSTKWFSIDKTVYFDEI